MPLGEVGQAEALERCFQQEGRTVEHKLAFNANVELSPVLFELPCVKASAVGRQSKVEAILVRQILWRLGSLALSEIGGGAYDRHPQVGTNPNSYHILCNKLTGPNACVDLLRHNVREPVVDYDLDVNVGILRQNSP